MSDPNRALDARTRILNAALELFAERGYDGATTREIASRAGVAELTLFRHFGNKETLLKSALAPLAFAPGDSRFGPGERVEPDAFFEEVARRLWSGMMGPRRRLLQVLVGESVRRPELYQPMGQMPREFAARIGEYIASLQAEGHVRAGNPRLMALAFLGMFFSVAVGGEYLGSDGEAFSPDETIRAYVDVFTKGILSD